MKHISSASFLFVVNVLVSIWAWMSGPYFPVASGFLFGSFLLSSFLYSAALYAKAINPLSFSVLLYYTYGFVLPGLYVTRTDQFYWFSNALTHEKIELAAIVVFLGTIALFVGRLSRIKKTPLALKQEFLEVDKTRKLRRRERAITLFVVSCVTMFVAYNFLRYGPLLFWGTRELSGNYASSIGLNSTSIGLAKTSAQSVSISCFALTLYIRFRLKDNSTLILLASLFSILNMLAVNNPLFTPRYWTVATLTVLLTTALYPTFRRYKAAVFFLVPAMMFWVFPFLGSFNRNGDQFTLNFSTLSPTEFMAHGDLDGFQSMTNVVKLVEIDGLGFGSRIVSAFFFFLPRSLWAGKHHQTGVDAASAAGYSYTNISLPLPGEFYADGGILLTLAGMYLFGNAIRKLDWVFHSASSGTHSPRNIVIPVVTILCAGFAPIILRGSLLGVISGFATAIIFVFLWAVACRASFRMPNTK